MNDNFCKSIADAVSSRQIIIYGAGWGGAVMLSIIHAIGKDVFYFLDKDPEKQKRKVWGYEVKAPEDILYEDVSKIIVVIAVDARKEVQEMLVGFGLREGVEFIHGPTMCYQACDLVDPFLGYSRTTDINGFKIMGKYDKKNKSILCLGESTTDFSLYGIKSWPEFLSEFLKNDKINVLNGGVVGYTSSQELLKLIRDGLELLPDLVISYSGVNDLLSTPVMGHKYLYQMWDQIRSIITESSLIFSMNATNLSVSYGTQSHLDSAEYWYRNQIMMHNICCGFHVPFLGILQPTTYTKKATSRSVREKRIAENRANRAFIVQQYKKAKQLVNVHKEINILDFTTIFDECSNIYVDEMHVFEQGNKIIAETIYHIIKEKQLLNI